MTQTSTQSQHTHRIRLAEEWLHSCAGCEMAFLNIGEHLLDLLQDIDIVHMPVLMDHKYYGQKGEYGQRRLPKADIGLVSGGCANEEHKEILTHMRAQCDVLVALGTCATHGGIPAMANNWGMQETYEQVFQTSTCETTSVPADHLPRPLDRVYALDELVSIDLLLPGCPPNPTHIAEIIGSLVAGRQPQLPSKSVCDTCPAIRTGKMVSKEVKRFTCNCVFDHEQPIDTMRCLLEQGFLCMGPVTMAGCARDGAPCCIRARVPCRGCYGPARQGGHQMMDMLNAVSGSGVDVKSIVDRKNMLRFSGAHNRLRVRRKRK
ncbi:NADH-quinone oxidoreductase subunit B family protein [Desulfogranum japonicum]|uniref:NADH-quinone oxidoreductase subunit B family protein n=1 Tax=Desulfogranum japonicum TaxID=231447 RepID=UPI00068812C8|nr:methyl viologen-reducing hydrogenase [Desulfogranum japonicum]